ncbi:MAG: hypothetical protein HC840_04960 [Leptolyngbyaceae cyanobacterium RM2_2_4]|nr:hypothetical protein [Leptolyngbyaceae cyanobacterium RM2_2_4]
MTSSTTQVNPSVSIPVDTIVLSASGVVFAIFIAIAAKLFNSLESNICDLRAEISDAQKESRAAHQSLLDKIDALEKEFWSARITFVSKDELDRIRSQFEMKSEVLHDRISKISSK